MCEQQLDTRLLCGAYLQALICLQRPCRLLQIVWPRSCPGSRHRRSLQFRQRLQPHEEEGSWQGGEG
jgi:hypothetical protein